MNLIPKHGREPSRYDKEIQKMLLECAIANGYKIVTESGRKPDAIFINEM